MPPRKFVDLFRIPFVGVRRDDIATRAYFRWKNRSGTNWVDPISNWLEAELEEMTTAANEGLDSFRLTDRGDLGDRDFTELYCLVDADWFPRVRGTHVVVRGSKAPRRCAFCQRGPDDRATFKLEAHILPQLLGSNRVISYDECDECNQTHGRTLEDALGKMLLQERAFGGVPRTKVSLGSGRSSISSQARGRPLLIELVDGDESVTVSHPESHTMEIVAPNQSYSPMDAIKAIAKSAVLLLPKDRRAELEHVRRWIRTEISHESVPVVRVFIPGPNPFGTTGIAVWALTGIGVEGDASRTTPTGFPSYVVMIWTGSSAVVWSPAEVNGSHLPVVLLPPIPKPRVSGETRVGAYSVKEGRLNRPRPSAWSVHISGKVLRYSRDPVPVRVKCEDELGEFTLDSILTTNSDDDDSAPEVTYTITGRQIAGSITIQWEPAAGKARFGYADPASASSEDLVALRFLAAVREGAPFRIDEAGERGTTLLHWPRISYREDNVGSFTGAKT